MDSWNKSSSDRRRTTPPHVNAQVQACLLRWHTSDKSEKNRVAWTGPLSPQIKCRRSRKCSLQEDFRLQHKELQVRWRRLHVRQSCFEVGQKLARRCPSACRVRESSPHWKTRPEGGPIQPSAAHAGKTTAHGIDLHTLIAMFDDKGVTFADVLEVQYFFANTSTHIIVHWSLTTCDAARTLRKTSFTFPLSSMHHFG